MTLELTWIWPDTLITICATIVIGLVVHFIVHNAIRRGTARMNQISAKKKKAKKASPETTALPGANAPTGRRGVAQITAIAHLLESLWSILILVIVILTVLSTIGVPLSPVLASAGIGGLLLAFGAQSLVKDYLYGIAMVVEGQYGVGDQINVGEVTGTVESVTLRITQLRDANGMIWYIRNGEITRVGNISQGYSTGLVDVPVAYDADVAHVTEVLSEVVAEVAKDPVAARLLLGEPELLGVESITATTLTMRIRIKTPPNKQHGLSRDIRERAIAALAAADIHAPTGVAAP